MQRQMQTKGPAAAVVAMMVQTNFRPCAVCFNHSMTTFIQISKFKYGKAEMKIVLFSVLLTNEKARQRAGSNKGEH